MSSDVNGSSSQNNRKAKAASKKRQKENAATQVEVAVFLPGNFGMNNGLMFVRDTNPTDAPGLHLAVIDADAPLLKKRFQPRRDDDNKNLAKWHRSGRLIPLQLCWDPKEEVKVQSESSDGERRMYRRHLKSFGAGGNVEAGRRAVKGSSAEIEKIMVGKDLNILWVGGGGGTGTAVAEEVNLLSREKRIPLISILTTPFNHEGEKIAICDQLAKDLHSWGRVLIIKNSKLPEEHRKKLPSEVYGVINQEIKPIFTTLKVLTQTVGTTSNVDLEDVLTFLERGSDLYFGYHVVKVDKNSQPANSPIEVNVEEIVPSLMGHIYQNQGIRAEGMILCFHGLWSQEAQEKIITGLQEATGSQLGKFIKSQNVETDKEMWVSALISGTYPGVEGASRAEQVQVQVQPQTATYTNGTTKKAMLLPMAANSGGEYILLRVPADLMRRWKDALEKNDRAELEVLRSEFAVYGKVPDMPTLQGV